MPQALAPTHLSHLSLHLLGVAGWDLLEALAGFPESYILCAEFLLQELLEWGEGEGRPSDTG